MTKPIWLIIGMNITSPPAMGLCDLMTEEESRIVEMSAYSTMITATAIDYIHIPLKNILVVEDEKVKRFLMDTMDLPDYKILTISKSRLAI